EGTPEPQTPRVENRGGFLPAVGGTGERTPDQERSKASKRPHRPARPADREGALAIHRQTDERAVAGREDLWCHRTLRPRCVGGRRGSRAAPGARASGAGTRAPGPRRPRTQGEG